MARPLKMGLFYFTKEVDYYDDYKIMDLMNEYGPLGQTIYDILLTIIYHEGYYLAIPLDKLAAKIVRIIGNRWVKDKKTVVQVILYCADIGLLNKDLLNQCVITSVGIQKRYAEATVRRQPIKNKKYWLLDNKENEEPLLNVPQNHVSVTETQVNVTETMVSDSNNATKKSKEKKSISNTICLEQKKTEHDTGHIITLTLNDKSEYPIFLGQVSEWEDLYPAVNINQELRKMKAWLNANPRRRKTKRGILRFINNWLSSAQDRGNVYSNSTNISTSNKFNQFPQRAYTANQYSDMESKLLQK